MKKIFTIFLCLVINAFAYAKEKKEIVITYVKSPLNIPSILEKKLNLFEEEFAGEGFTFSYPEITAGPDQTQALAAGSVDVANCVGGVSVIIATASGLDIKGAFIYGRAPQTYMIITNDPSVKTISDLKGKKVAGPKGTVLHQILASAVTEAGLKLNDVEHLSMGIPAALAAVESKNVSAALLAGPSAEKALQNGGRVLTTGQGHTDATVLVAVSGKLEKEYPGITKRFKKVHRKALKYMQDHPQETWEITAKETGLSVEQVKQMQKLYDFSPEIRKSDIDDLKATQKFLLDNKMIKKAISIENMMNLK